MSVASVPHTDYICVWFTCVTLMASGAQNGFESGEPLSFVMVNYGAFKDNGLAIPVPSLSKPTKEERVSQCVLDAASRA